VSTVNEKSALSRTIGTKATPVGMRVNSSPLSVLIRQLTTTQSLAGGFMKGSFLEERKLSLPREGGGSDELVGPY